MNFLRLRTDEHAQLEIRQYADIVAGMVKLVCPLTFEAWYDYVYGAKSFSRLEIKFMDHLINRGPFDQECYEEICLNEKNDGETNYHIQLGITDKELALFWKKVSPKLEKDFDLDPSKGKLFEELCH